MPAPGVPEVFARLSVGDGPKAWGWAAAATGVLWGLWYFFWRPCRPRSHPRRPLEAFL